MTPQSSISPYRVTAKLGEARLAVRTDDGKEAAVWICRLPEKSALQRLMMEGRNRYPIGVA